MADAARTLLETDIGTLTTPVDLPGHVDWAPRPMVRAAVEMAALDLALKASNTSLARWLGTSRATVPAGATIGLGSRQELNDKIEALLDLGYRRIKLKIEPGRDLDVVTAAIDTVRRRATSTRIQVDANGSYPPSSQSLNSLVALARLGVSVIEQPFAPDRTEASKSLISTFVSAGIGTLVLADEGASSFDEALKRIREGAASGLVVKPSRLGGIREAVRLMAHCRQHRLPVSVGGMLESGLGRHALAAVAALEGASVTGDLSPARRFLGDDPWPDITMVNGSTSTEGAKISVPSAPGVAPAPDELRLDLYTVERRQLGDVHV
jgi:O-succinylbenzoate synthase